MLSPYTLKVRFSDTWYIDPGKFCVVYPFTGVRKEATKIVDGVVYYIFTEEEAHNAYITFEKHEPIKEPNGKSMTHNTFGVTIKFFDTIMDDVISDIDSYARQELDVPIGSAYI